jgi:hemoglobin
MTGVDRRERISAEIADRTGKHLQLGVDANHFDRWLGLFEQTAREVCPPEAEAHFVERARRIAASLELGIANGQGVMLAVGERFRRQQEGAV